MPQKSTSKKIPKGPPHFKNEAEEADWLASPAGRRFTSHSFQEKMSAGRIIVTEKTKLDKELIDEMKRSDSAIHFKNGIKIKPSDPTMIQDLMDRAKAKQTQSVSLRISIADLEAAKKLAEKAGIGYQTVLKDLIHEGLRRAL